MAEVVGWRSVAGPVMWVGDYTWWKIINDRPGK